MIECENLVKRFGPVTAVSHVSFEVQKGEVVGFLGPNGAGKTTTLRILTGFLKPDQGTARIAGYDVLENPLEVKKRIGYLAEDNPLYHPLLVREYLHFIAEVRRAGNGRREDAVRRAIELSGLEGMTRRPIGELSKGYKQRVGLAAAMIHNPDILILDEPTSGLDPTQIVEIRELIRQLGREKTILLSTHILPEVSATCNRVLIIHQGRIAASGTPGELARQVGARENVRFGVRADPVEVEGVLKTLPWLANHERNEAEEGGVFYTVEGQGEGDLREQLFRLAVEHQWTLLELTRKRVSLEEVFLKLTTSEAS